MVKKDRITLAILQARMSSSRLPGKVMMTLNGQPMIYRQIERIRHAATIDKIVVATSTDQSDDLLVNYLTENDIDVYRGSLNDVLSRFLEIERKMEVSAIIRLTGDCPLVIPALIDTLVTRFYAADVDYLSNTLEPTYPDGLDIEVIRPGVLETLSEYELSQAEKEHVTLGIYSRPSKFTLENFSHNVDLSHNRWTVDQPEDLEFVRRVYSAFIGREATFSFEDVVSYLKNEPDLRLQISFDPSKKFV
jgi:spore coat polysaccharide biosynthesis protein SpsF